MSRIKITIFLLIILATFTRLIILLNSDNFDGAVPMSMVASAISILENPSLRLNFDGNTSVLYQYLLAIVLHFWHDPLFAPRIFNMLFGILLIIPFYFLIKVLFDDRIALYSTIILSLYPLHAIQSTLSTHDVVFYFFFFSCLYYFFKFKQEEKKMQWLIFAAIFFNIASLLRFESWLFIPLLAVFLYKEGKRYMLTFPLLFLILPCVWLYLCYHYTGRALYSFIMSSRTAQAEIVLYGIYARQVFGWLDVLYKTLGHPVLICGIGGMLYAFMKRKFFHLAVFFLYLYSCYTVNNITGRMWHNPRYSITLGLLILPYSILCLERISVLLRSKPDILLLPFIIFVAFLFKNIINSSLPRLPEKIKEIPKWMELNISPANKLILGSDKWNATDQDIIVRSGISPRNFLLVTTPLASSGSINKESIRNYIKDIQPHYLIFNSGGFLQKVLEFDMSKKNVNELGYNFELIYSQDVLGFGKYNIYRICHKDN